MTMNIRLSYGQSSDRRDGLVRGLRGRELARRIWREFAHKGVNK